MVEGSWHLSTSGDGTSVQQGEATDIRRSHRYSRERPQDITKKMAVQNRKKRIVELDVSKRQSKKTKPEKRQGTCLTVNLSVGSTLKGKPKDARRRSHGVGRLFKGQPYGSKMEVCPAGVGRKKKKLSGKDGTKYSFTVSESKGKQLSDVRERTARGMLCIESGKHTY